jgi:hypothetical protein
MTRPARATQIRALAERSSYVENVLRHALVAAIAGEQWMRNPLSCIQILNSEVDDSGFDIVLALGNRARYIQLKQTHSEKTPPHVSVRLSFATMLGSCVVLVAHNLHDLSIANFRFFGSAPDLPMPDISAGARSIVPGRRNAAGERKRREGYRNVALRRFSPTLSSSQLLDMLFP